MTCSGLAIEDFTPSLGPLTDAAADDPRVVLFGVYQLGQLVAERRRVSGEDLGEVVWDLFACNITRCVIVADVITRGLFSDALPAPLAFS